MLKWVDSLDIIALDEKFPDTDPQYVRFTDLHNWVCNLDDFEDEPENSNEKILEAIQMAWIEERGMTDRTLAIIKPDAVKRNLIGKIISLIEDNDFVINQIKSYHLSTVEAEMFYDVHKGKSFFKSLVDYMTSGQIIALLAQRMMGSLSLGN